MTGIERNRDVATFVRAIYRVVITAPAKMLLIASLPMTIVSFGAHAETRPTSIYFQSVCGDKPDTTYVDSFVDLSLDGVPLQAGSNAYPKVGAHSLTIALKVPKGQEGKWSISKIEQPAEAHGPARRLLQTPDSVDTTVALNLPPQESDFDWIPTDVYVTVNVCARVVKLKIATTISCTGAAGEDFKVQGDVTVNIGGRIFTSNPKGVIEAEIPTGTYPVTASWTDAAVAYVTQNGAKVPPNESGLRSVRLAEAVELLEVRIANCDTAGREKARAVVSEIGPDSRIDVTRSKSRGDAFVGMQLRDGDIVKVKGLAKIKWVENGHIISFENPKGSALIVIGPDKPPPTGTKIPERYGPNTVQVLKGVVRFLFPTNPDNDPENYNGGVSTNTVSVGVKGTVFSVGYDEETEVSTVILEEGVVTVTPTNPELASFDLEPGQQVTVSPTEISPIAYVNVMRPVMPLAGTPLGCFKDTGALDLDGYLEHSPVNTPARCIATCAAKGFKYSAVQYGQSCLCGDSYGRYGPANNCDYRCTGDASQICGGYAANSVYSTGN